MPGVRTAAQLVRQTREHAQEISGGTYRDGFADDTNIPGVGTGSIGTTGAVALSADSFFRLISVLSFVNQAMTLFSQSGAIVLDFTPITVVSGTDEYQIPQGAGDINRALLTMAGVTTDLAIISVDDLRRRVAGYVAYPPGRPTVGYPQGQNFSVWPVPNAGGTLTLRAEGLEPDLVARTDAPLYLPSRYHDALAMCAAMMLCASDAENEAKASRVSELSTMWQQQAADLVRLIDARSVIDSSARPGT